MIIYCTDSCQKAQSCVWGKFHILYLYFFKAMKTRKIIITSAVSAAVILGTGFLITQVSGEAYVPQAFFEQRVAGAGASKNIARMVADSLDNLVKIEEFDRIGNVNKALELVKYEQTNRQDKQNAAVVLAGNLEQMAKYTETITPESARRLSVEAVTSGVAMVSHLINYNTYLDALFAYLEIKFSGNLYEGLSGQEIIAKINNEAKAINESNVRFNELLDKFDRKYID